VNQKKGFSIFLMYQWVYTYSSYKKGNLSRFRMNVHPKIEATNTLDRSVFSCKEVYKQAKKVPLPPIKR